MEGPQSRLIELDPQGGNGASVEETNSPLLESRDFRPSEVLVQVLRRPNDPISSRLNERLMQWVAAGIAYQPLEDAFGGWIDVARNWQTLLFLNAKRFKYLLILDNDVSPPLETPMLLARHDKPVVSGVVPAYNQKDGLLLCVGLQGRDRKVRFPTLNGTKTVPSRGLVEVHNAGAGCLMVRRDVIARLWQDFDDAKVMEGLAREADVEFLDAISEGRFPRLTTDQLRSVKNRLKRSMAEVDLTGPPFSIPEKTRWQGAREGIMPRGEDICFTDRVREAGFKLYADFEVRCYHEKLMTLSWPKDALDPQIDPQLWKDAAFADTGMPVVQSEASR